MRIIAASIPGSKWLKASVIASFWAATEIILGSFLHNMRFPLSGTLLSFASVMLVISFAAGWKQNGIIWRAGLICALLKSISPSAIILGPMIGIFTEALLLELAVLLLGHNLLAYSVGGALAVFSALLHKVVSLLILYGFDLVRILEALYTYAIKQIGIKNLPGEKLLWIISILYLLAGMLAAIAGYWVSRLSLKEVKDDKRHGYLKLNNEKTFINKTENQKYSVWLLGLNMFAIILLLYMINNHYIIPALILAAVYLAFVFYHYRHSLRYLKKPLFWIQFIVITMVASLLLDSITQGTFFSVKGLMVGLNMNFRALIIILGFSAISTELRNPVIRAVSLRGGLSSLYQSVNLTFSALPAVLNEFPGVRIFIRHPLRSLAGFIPVSEQLISSFEKTISGRKPVVMISGERQQGKTTYVYDLVKRLKNKPIKMTGFFATGVHEGEQRVGFDLVDIASTDAIPLCRLDKKGDQQNHHRFRFFDKALLKGREILSSGDAQLVVIDEVGPYELQNEGWATSIQNICQKQRSIQIWTVRKQLVERIAATWPVGDIYVVDIEKDSLIATEALIMGLLDKHRLEV
ncbi:MAG: hypothetical protein IPH45_14870 [Bacteroidales bacterium]|nr:hypothetical protein [Bacteroidales bacterium]